MVKTIKVQSGKEFEIKSLTLPQRVEIDDLLQEYYFKLGVNTSVVKEITAAPVSFRIALRSVQYGLKEVPDTLTNLELIELQTEIQNLSHLNETEKKS